MKRDRSKRTAQRRASAKNSCACGCGALAVNHFVSGHNTRLHSSAEQSRRGSLNTGAHFLDTGTKDTYRKVDQRHEHRTVAEQKLGRALLPGEVVHHIDEVKRNNDPANLEVFASQAEHARHHRLEKLRGA